MCRVLGSCTSFSPPPPFSFMLPSPFSVFEQVRLTSSSLPLEIRLIDFFRFYCQAFAFNTDVVSIRAGLVTKESKNWTTDSDVGGMNEMSRERNRLCIEDPFERSYVSPCGQPVSTRSPYVHGQI